MERPVSTSTTEGQDGIKNPGEIIPIANAARWEDATFVGEMYSGNDYDDSSAWLSCHVDDLQRIRR